MKRVIKVVDIEIKHPDFDPNPQKSTTNNHKWRQGLFVNFMDNMGNKYSWMPKWKHLEELVVMREKVEAINKELCKLHNQGDKK